MLKLTFFSTALAFTLSAAAALAADETNTVPGFTAAGAPLGLHGADPVALVQTGEVVEGSAEHTAVYEGVAYYFASEVNMATFTGDAPRFVPQHGGYCSYGVSIGKKFDGDPRFAAVREGRLFLFLNAEVFAAFEQDQAGTIAEADRRWGQIRSVAAADL